MKKEVIISQIITAIGSIIFAYASFAFVLKGNDARQDQAIKSLKEDKQDMKQTIFRHYDEWKEYRHTTNEALQEILIKLEKIKTHENNQDH